MNKMRKMICLLLVVVLELALCACSPAGTKAGLQVGYAREDITPKEPVPLDGYGNSEVRISTGTLDPLYVTCVAVRDGEETVLLITVDLISQKGALVSAARDSIAEKTGVPKDKIMISFTHTHSCPDVTSSHPGVAAFLEQYWIGVDKAAVDAIADLAPAKLYGTKTQTEKLNFVRHYLMNDGTYYGSNFGSASSGFKDYAAVSDSDMILVKAEREGDKKDILIMNWGAHPCKTGGVDRTDVSADFVGSCRVAVERDSNMLFAFYQGAAGNQNTGTFIAEDNLGLSYIEHGERLCKTALDAIPDMQPLEGSGIKTYQLYYEADVNHADEHLGAAAAQVKAYWDSTKDREGGNALAVSLGLTSVYHANGVLAQFSRPQRQRMELDALCIGDLAIVFAPYEMFSDHSLYIKEKSPFNMTLVFTVANENYYYIPSAEAYEYGCYESYVAVFAKGVGESTADKLLEMLNNIK